jgi:hypothetical protein
VLSSECASVAVNATGVSTKVMKVRLAASDQIYAFTADRAAHEPARRLLADGKLFSISSTPSRISRSWRRPVPVLTPQKSGH